MLTPATCALLLLLAAICIFAVINYRKKLRSGCCGGSSDRLKRTRPAAAPVSDTVYVACAVIDGMICQNCAIRIENAINQETGLSGMVTLGRRLLTIRSATPISEVRVRQIVARADYRVVSFEG